MNNLLFTIMEGAGRINETRDNEDSRYFHGKIIKRGHLAMVGLVSGASKDVPWEYTIITLSGALCTSTMVYDTFL